MKHKVALFISLCLPLSSCNTYEEPEAKYETIWEITYSIHTRYKSPNEELNKWFANMVDYFDWAQFGDYNIYDGTDTIYMYTIEDIDDASDFDTSLFSKYAVGNCNWKQRLYNVSPSEVKSIVESFNSLSSDCYNLRGNYPGILCRAYPTIIKGEQTSLKIESAIPYVLDYKVQFFKTHNIPEKFFAWTKQNAAAFAVGIIRNLEKEPTDWIRIWGINTVFYEYGSYDPLDITPMMKYDIGELHWQDKIYATEDEVKRMADDFNSWSMGDYEKSYPEDKDCGPYVKFTATYSREE